MRIIAILVSLVGYVYCQTSGITIHGHDLNVLIAKGFNRLDTNHDRILEANEYEAILKRDDDNGDGIITCTEYEAHTTMPQPLAREFFTHLDPNGDCSMTHAEALSLLQRMDQTGDGKVVEHEFEHFYVQILKHLGHIDHGHQHQG